MVYISCSLAWSTVAVCYKNEVKTNLAKWSRAHSNTKSTNIDILSPYYIVLGQPQPAKPARQASQWIPPSCLQMPSDASSCLQTPPDTSQMCQKPIVHLKSLIGVSCWGHLLNLLIAVIKLGHKWAKTPSLPSAWAGIMVKLQMLLIFSWAALCVISG